MESKDEALIQELVGQNEELRKLVEEHKEYEKVLEDFAGRPYLTTEESVEKKRLQKLKLSGKDRIEAILTTYRKNQETA